MTIWVNIRIGDERESNQNDHSFMLDAQEALDTLADQLSVQRLSTFYDDTDLQYNMDESDEFEDSEDGWPNDEAKWFDPKAGLHSLTALLAHLKEHPQLLETHGDVTGELEDCRTELEKAVQSNRAFHFCLVM